VFACVGPKDQEGVPTLDTLSALPGSATVEVGGTVQLGAQRLKGGEATNVTSQATWTTSDANVAVVDGAGLVEAIGTGTATITADLDGFQSSTEVVVISPIESVEIEQGLIQLAKGTTRALLTTMIAEDKTKRPLDGAFSWGTSDPEIATVDETGLVTGVEPGTVVITLVRDGTTSSQTVTVTDAELVSIAVVARFGTTLPINAATAVRVIGTFSDDTTQRIESLFTFTGPEGTEEEPPVVTTSGAAVIAGETAGMATVTLKGNKKTAAQGQEAELVITVTDDPLSAITLDVPATVSTAAGLFFPSATGTYGTLEFPIEPTWSADPAEPVFINNVEQSIEPLAPGNTTLTAELDDIEATAAVTIVDSPFSSLIIESDTSEIELGSFLDLEATASFGAAMTDVTADVYWTSTDPAVAVVSNARSGRVTGLTLGTADIQAFYKGAVRATQTVTVIPPVIP
jgi:uncharacterized protein YjdB